jgi:hypothetical protein
VAFDGLRGTLTLNCEGMHFTDWPAPIPYREITQFFLNEGTLEIKHGPGGKQKQKLRVKDLHQREAALDAISRYHGRYMHAVAYQTEKRLTASESVESARVLAGTAS